MHTLLAYKKSRPEHIRNGGEKAYRQATGKALPPVKCSACWIPASMRAAPIPGTRVVVLNGIRAWVTTWREGFLNGLGQFPVTHFTLDVEGNWREWPRPYPQLAEDKTGQADIALLPTPRRPGARRSYKRRLTEARRGF